MGILQAENNVAYTSHNAIKIYIIKQTDISNQQKFETDYASILKKSNEVVSPSKFLNLKADNIQQNRTIQLTPLICYQDPNNEVTYTKFDFKLGAADLPGYYTEGDIRIDYDSLWFLTSLIQLRNCPLLDFSKLAYVFQIEGQSQGGLANVISFNTTFNVNGQSSAEIVLNNRDFLYNFKYFNDKEKYNYHLKSYFDNNDIIIIRMQKRNNEQTSLLNSFKDRPVEYWKDAYMDSETDPFTTVFTGYINDINDSFSFTNGQQTVTLSCTGPSKKLTWTRIVKSQALATKDSYSALLPISAYANPQTIGENGKTDISNEEVVKNLIVRVYSGILNVPSIKQAYDKFVDAFDKYNSLKTDLELKQLRAQKLSLEQQKASQKEIANLQKQIDDRVSVLKKIATDQRVEYEKNIKTYFKQFIKENDNEFQIKKHTFLPLDKFGECPSLFVVNGTHQPAYQWSFQNFSSLFVSDYSTAYQFIKSIADDLQFNFYDDPCGTIHFEIPDMTLMHLHKQQDPNNLTQLLSFSETQNTENIANVQVAEAKYFYDMPISFINTVIKDYRSIQKYGEKMMQPFNMTGLTNITAIKYAAKMRMAKYNRKAMSNIRVNMQGEPNLQLGKYAYIKSLRKLFYVESYSHSYNAGGDLTTSLNGTYTREILAYAKQQDSKQDNKISSLINIGSSKLSLLNNKTLLEKLDNNINLNKQLSLANNIEEVLNILQQIELPDPNILANAIYNIYIENWKYPAEDEDLREEIGAMYNQNNLRQCYFDDFFWAIPFDCDPYQIAETIQKNELEKMNQFSKTASIQSSSRNRISKINKVQTIKTKQGFPACKFETRKDKGTKEKPKQISIASVLGIDTSKIPSFKQIIIGTKKNER